MRLISLALLSALYGASAAWIFRRLTSPAPLRRAINQIIAHILEFSLFIDEPRVILRAQRDLIRANLRLLQQIALPALILAAAFALLYPPLDHYFGRGPLPINEPIVVTIHSDARALELTPPPGIVVETPGVRIIRTHETSWRIRRVGSGAGEFQAATAIDIPYPRTHWIAWFVLISTATGALVSLRLTRRI